MRAVAIAVAAALALAGAACGGDSEGEGTPTAAATAAAATGSAAALDGTYAVEIAEEDTTTAAGAQPGRWTLTIASGQATLNGPGGRRIPLMPITLTETQMVVPPDPQCPNNRPSPGKGTYEVDLRGESLRFKKQRDPCGDRAFTLTVHTWQRTDGS